VTKFDVGVIHGRFQPLHLGHLEYLLAGADRCRTLVVGITNPDPWTVVDEPTDADRSRPDANVFTYYERYLMVEGALADAGIDLDRVRVVPFPHSFPERLRHYAPADARYFVTVYDDWGEAKIKRFQALGLAVEVLWRREDKPISGARVRAALAAGNGWRALVPPATVRVVEASGGDARFRG